jgi:zinc protease
LLQLRDIPQAVAEQVFASLLYGEHPYGHLPIGTVKGLRSADRDRVAEFHSRFYNPSAVTLIAAGDFEHEQLFDAANDVFGGWSAETPEANTAPAWRALPSPPRLAIVNRKGASQSELRIGHVAEPRSTPEYFPLLVLNTVLGGQFVSRINLNLREDKGYTYGARTTFDFRREPGPFVFQTSVQTEVTAAAVTEALRELEDIRGARPATEAELELARAALTRGYPRNFETAEQVARAAAQLAMHRLPEDYFERFVEEVLNVTPGDVSRVATTCLHPSGMTTLVVGDNDRIARWLEELGLGPPLSLPTPEQD